MRGIKSESEISWIPSESDTTSEEGAGIADDPRYHARAGHQMRI